MKILVVIDQFDNGTNGTTMSARRFVENLRLRGHEVRVLCCGEPGPGKFVVPEKNIPVVTYFSRKQGMVYAKPIEPVIREALADVDIVHYYMPFGIEIATDKIAREMGLPRLAAYHVQAENITYFLKLGKCRLAGAILYKAFNRRFFCHFEHIHCPSQFIADELAHYGYKAQFHVISNGIAPDFAPQEPVPHEGFNILMTGRYAPEKKQDVLIKAARFSKYKDDIQLFFAGIGPYKEKYEKLGSKLPRPPIFFSYKIPAEILERMAQVDLYVHAANAEIEAIACMEAFAAGLVPVIANSPKSATRYFALDERSLFKPEDPQDLAQKIDWWIEHPEERAEMGKRYAEHAKQYSIESSITKIEAVYNQIIEEENEKRMAATPQD